MRRLLVALFILSLVGSLGAAQGKEDQASEVKKSTIPIGSPFFRHLAYDFNLNLKELDKFERNGFGRTETVTISLISLASGKPLKYYGKKRLKEKLSLKKMAREANLDYRDLYRISREIKADIEKEGDKNLPPPIFRETRRKKMRIKEDREIEPDKERP